MGVDFDHVFSYHSPDLQQTMAYAELRNKAKEFAILIEKLVPPGADCSAAMRFTEREFNDCQCRHSSWWKVDT